MSLLPTMTNRKSMHYGEVLISLPKKIRKGEIIEVQVQILHPAQRIPGNAKGIFIQELWIAMDGSKICYFDWSSRIAPDFAVPLLAEKSGILSVHWIDNQGKVGSGKRTFTVSV